MVLHMTFNHKDIGLNPMNPKCLNYNNDGLPLQG